MERDALVDPSRQRSLMHGAVELSGGQGLDRVQAWEEPPAIEHLALGTGDAPPGAQPLEHHRGEHGVAVLAALACWMRRVMRVLSMSPTFSEMTSLARSPAP